MMYTQEQKDAIAQMKGTVGYQVFEAIVKAKVAELDTVRNIDGRLTVDKAGVEALARQKAVKLLDEFFNDLDFLTSTTKESNTYV